MRHKPSRTNRPRFGAFVVETSLPARHDRDRQPRGMIVTRYRARSRAFAAARRAASYGRSAIVRDGFVILALTIDSYGAPWYGPGVERIVMRDAAPVTR